MKSIAFLAFLAFATAFEVGSYQTKHIVVSDGSITVAYRDWNIVLMRPVDNFNFLEVLVSGPNNFNRKVLIDNQFLVIKDYYLNNDYARNYLPHYDIYRQQFGRYFGQANFNQFEYLLSIFKQYVGIIDIQQWSQMLNTLQMEVQQGRVHFLIFEFFRNFGVNEEFFYGKYNSQFYGPYQCECQYYGACPCNYGRNLLFGKYNGNNELTGISNQDSYGQQYYGPYNQQYYGREFYAPQNQQYYGQEYSGPCGSPYYGQQYQCGSYQQQYYGQQYPRGQSYPYQQYYGRYYSYPQYQSNYYEQNYQQYPYVSNRFVNAY